MILHNMGSTYAIVFSKTSNVDTQIKVFKEAPNTYILLNAYRFYYIIVKYMRLCNGVL